MSAAFGFASIWMYLNVWRDNCLQNQSEALQGAEESSGPAFNSLWFIGSLFLYACALASKAQWVPLCGILILIDLYQRRKLTWKVWMGYVPFFLLSVVFAWYAIDSQLIVGKKGAYSTLTLVDRLSKPLLGIGYYLWRIVWPVNLCPRYPEVFSFHRELIGLGLLTVVLGGIGMVWSWRQRREFFFGAAWFLFFLSPILNFLPGNLVVADRYLYVAMIGLMLPLGLKLSQYRTEIGFAVIGLVTVLQLGLTLRYVPKWQDDFTLWQYTVSLSPDNIFAFTALGQAQIERKEYAAARNSLNQAIAIGRWFSPIYLTLAKEEKNLGGDAMAILDQARQRWPDVSEVMAAYGYYWVLHQNDLEAEKWFLQSLRQKSTIEVLKHLGTVYERLNEPDKGLEMTFRGLQTYPFDEEFWLVLGRLLEMKGNLTQAEEAYHQVARLAPEVTEAHYRLAHFAYQRGDIQTAENSFQTMYLNLNGKQMPAPALNLWAAVYRQKKQYTLAIAKLTEALHIQENADYWLNLALLQVEIGENPQPAIEKAITLDPSYKDKVAKHPRLGPLQATSSQKALIRP
ncbi:MAG: tetratricopeptide repeat protein [Acidobacteria bacterium]|nr:tetratricopeptide repeat protein [Acidobacteriota bacterium]